MYCPVCGDEYREGITRCPEHDVELVEEPPELEEAPSWLDRFNDRIALRVTFIILVISGVVYALSGFVTGALFGLAEFQNSQSADMIRVLQPVQSAFWSIGKASLGVLAGAVLLRGYLSLSRGSERALSDDERSLGPGSVGGPSLRPSCVCCSPLR